MNVCTRSFFSLSDKTDDDDPSSVIIVTSWAGVAETDAPSPIAVGMLEVAMAEELGLIT